MNNNTRFTTMKYNILEQELMEKKNIIEFIESKLSSDFLTTGREFDPKNVTIHIEKKQNIISFWADENS